MKQIFKLGLIAALVMISFQGISQLAKEKVHDISKASWRGYLSNVEVDDAAQTFDMQFVTKSSTNSIKLEHYVFNYLLELVSQESEEIPLEKARTKYKFRGEQYTETILSAGPDLAGNLTVKKIEVTGKYNWFTGGYKVTQKVLSTEKFTDPISDRKMLYVAHMDLAETKEVIVLAKIKGKAKDFAKYLGKYQLLKIDLDLKITNEETIDMEHPGALISQGYGDKWYMLFATTESPYGKKYQGPDPTVNHLLCVDWATGKLSNDVVFNSKAHSWNVSQIMDKDGIVTINGPAVKKNYEKTYRKAYVNPNQKFDAYQVAMIQDGAVKWVAAPTLEEINAVGKKPAEQKKFLEYDGKKLTFTGASLTRSNELFITMQDYTQVADRGWYTDLYMFQFGADGKFISNYGVKSTAKKGGNQIATVGEVFEGPASKKMYWFLSVVKGVDPNTGNISIVPRLGKIDKASGEIDNFFEFGDGKFFVFNNVPFIRINGGKQVIYLGEGGERGKQIWLGLVDFATL